MQCIIKRRANTPEQKALRLQQIMAATATRFTTLNYDQVNLNHIAADVGITKAALYRYFRNKETLFLALYTRQIEQFIITAKAEMQKAPLTAAICNALVQHPLFCHVSALWAGCFRRLKGLPDGFRADPAVQAPGKFQTPQSLLPPNVHPRN